MNRIVRLLRLTPPMLALALISAFCLAPHHSNAQTVAEYHQRADLLLENYLVKYWDGSYIRNTGEWTYIHGMDAVIDGAERTGKQKYYGLIETFYEAQDSRHGWLNDYYDDENWFVLTLIHAYDVTGETKYLNKAREIYADIQTNAWDTTCCGTVKGGLWWNKPHTQKATASNAGAVISGIRLYQRTGLVSYRNFAKKVYDFWWDNMVDKTTYQVADHIDPDGTKVWWKFTYNEGLMIGASLELSRAYRNPSYLTKAHNIAGFMINNETKPTSYGNVLSDGNAAQCGGDCHQFKGPGYRYLMQLYLHDKSKTAYYNVLKASVDALWNLARTSDHSVGVDWTGPTTAGPFNDQTQNAAAQAMSLFAKQNGAYPGAGTPAGQYEAENATIRGILLEANQPPFSGWGFLGGWMGSGKFVKFTVNNATAGNKTVTLRYAAAAGDAYRNISVNGTPVTTLLLPGTSGWNLYSTASFTYHFPAGTSTILIDYNANYVNLDHIQLGAPAARLAAEETKLPAIIAYPNPVRQQDVLNVDIYAQEETEAQFQFANLLSQPLIRQHKQLQKGENTVQLSIHSLRPGTYLLQVNQGKSREIRKVVITQ